MATKHNERCFQNSADDEPVFTLCARDKVAPATVRDWADRAGAIGAPPEKTVKARQIAEEMDRWQEEHPELVKVPD